MADKTFDIAWVSEVDSVSNTCSIQTRDQQFYKHSSKTQVHQHEEGYTALVEINNGKLSKIFDTEFVQLPGKVVRSHLAWRHAHQVDNQGMLLHNAASMKEPALKELLIAVLCDEKIMQPFYQARASKDFHHNEEGELFNHSVQVARTAAHLAQRHELEQCDVECAFVSGFLHDTGKILMFYNTDTKQQKGVNGQHEAFNFMVLAEHLEALKDKDKALFEAVSATLSTATTRRKKNEYIVEAIVRAADRISAKAYMHRAAFKGKPIAQLRMRG